MATGRYLKPLRNSGELYTPITEEIVEILWSLHREYGTWGGVSEACGIRKRMLYRIREYEYKTVSIGVLDRILTNSNSAHRVEDFKWFDVDGLIEEGVFVSEEDHWEMIYGPFKAKRYREMRQKQAA